MGGGYIFSKRKTALLAGVWGGMGSLYHTRFVKVGGGGYIFSKQRTLLLAGVGVGSLYFKRFLEGDIFRKRTPLLAGVWGGVGYLHSKRFVEGNIFRERSLLEAFLRRRGGVRSLYLLDGRVGTLNCSGRETLHIKRGEGI